MGMKIYVVGIIVVSTCSWNHSSIYTDPAIATIFKQQPGFISVQSYSGVVGEAGTFVVYAVWESASPATTYLKLSTTLFVTENSNWKQSVTRDNNVFEQDL